MAHGLGEERGAHVSTRARSGADQPGRKEGRKWRRKKAWADSQGRTRRSQGKTDERGDGAARRRGGDGVLRRRSDGMD
uniref:Uncharacterized protein n=1 Tax=Arundo donax TaxID=35708 RepID=A0A0A8YJY9_ARUDO